MNTITKTGGPGRLWAALAGLFVLPSLLTAVPAAAQAEDWETSVTKLGADLFAAGDDLALGGNQGLTWAAGNTIEVTEATGGIIAAGYTIDVQQGADGPILAAGSAVSIKGPVAGSIYAAGDQVDLDVQHGRGTVFAAGSRILFKGETAGSVFLAGDEVRVEGRIAGDLFVSAEGLSIADDAVVGGEIVYDVSDRDGLSLPAGLRSREVTESEFHEEAFGQFNVNTGSGAAGDLGFFIFSLIVGLLVILVMRRQSDHVATWLQTRPLQTLGTGFVGLSFWMGLTLTTIAVVLALASGLSWFLLVLLALVPVAMLAGFLLMVVGYYHGVYAVGALAGRYLPSGLSPVIRRLVVLAVTLLLLFLVGLLSSGLSMLLGAVCLLIGFGALGLRIWRGQPPVIAA